MTIALILLVAALIFGILALVGVASRVDLTAAGLILVCIALLLDKV